mmetsp:Transcript_52251/g.62947  ORF Transcript_52251/g.62947 Transcript_52251/m.62947 type:complete len:234 (-) Transcript_52251:89-790(-)
MPQSVRLVVELVLIAVFRAYLLPVGTMVEPPALAFVGVRPAVDAHVRVIGGKMQFGPVDDGKGGLAMPLPTTRIDDIVSIGKVFRQHAPYPILTQRVIRIVAPAHNPCVMPPLTQRSRGGYLRQNLPKLISTAITRHDEAVARRGDNNVIIDVAALATFRRRRTFPLLSDRNLRDETCRKPNRREKKAARAANDVPHRETNFDGVAATPRHSSSRHGDSSRGHDDDDVRGVSS